MRDRSMPGLKDELKRLSADSGMKMFGVAPTVGRFDDGSEDAHPAYYLKGARSVISIGVNILRKCLRVCPTGAFLEHEMREVTIGGVTYRYAAIDKIRCYYAILGMVKGSAAAPIFGYPRERETFLISW